GAWRWLPAYDMGLAVEMSAAEAYAPLGVLRTVFGVVFGALVVAVLAAFGGWFAAARLRSQAEERRVGAYLLGERIGEGGVGNVYLARHDLLKRPTAVKLLKPTRATDEMTARFEREAQLASQLSHPNMVEIYDYGRASDGSLYYAMEYLEGETIGRLVMEDGALPVARAVHLLRQVCAGLSEAHGKGMVHRDVSPTNIMVCHYGGEYDFAKILDFGLVKHVAAVEQETITRTLRLLGTPLYMAPERLRDPADVDARADIYAVGAVAFFVLTAHRMFETLDDLALTSLVLNEVPRRASSVAPQPLPAALDGLIAACLEKRREDRPQTIGECGDVLEALAVRHRWTQRDAEAAWAAHRTHGNAGARPGIQ
ncbi:MAG TPA: serine/threonine-protein kinase, partial [Burkholderiales bacterium]|nr:serine/threonine-protein kinase [Burkholderiales bacterium]